MTIEGIATITEKGFSFDSGMPSDEPMLDKPMRMRGTLEVGINASVRFRHNDRIYLPPEVHRIAQGDGYNVRRTSRHYIIQVKVPVVENRKTSEDRLNTIVPIVMSEITLDRKEVINV